MLFQMQITEMFSFVGIKDTKYLIKCFLFLPQNTKCKRVKTEHNLATQAVYEHLYIYINIYIYAIYLLLFHFEFICTFTFNT